MRKFLKLYDLLPQFVRRADVEQTYHSVETTLGTSVTGGSVQTVTPAVINGIHQHLKLQIDPGLATEEVVEVISVAGPSFTAFFNNNHDAGAEITDATKPPLAALLDSAQQQGDIVYNDIWKLWDNYFIETCDDWVVPYIADLIDLNLVTDDPANNRREVARTIAYRRRKGTVPQLEALASDVTGYSAHFTEFFERMLWNQCMFHFKPDDLHTADIRDSSALARIDHAFDRTSHTADLRPSSLASGWYNIRKIGFFLWRLRAIPLFGVDPRPAPAPAPKGAYHFNPLGQPYALFQNPDPPQRGVDQDWPRSTESDVVSPISPTLFAESPDGFWGTSLGFTIRTNGAPINDAPISMHVLPADLCAWTAPNLTPGNVAVDVRLGRFLFHPNDVPNLGTITVDYNFGFSGDVGGGGYARKKYLRPHDGETADIARVSTVPQPGTFATLSAALAQLSISVAAVRVLQIEDSRTYAETLKLPANFDTLIIQAANGQRPILDLSANSAFTGPTSGTQLILSGLLVSGAGKNLDIPSGIKSVVIEDCTIDPGGGLAEDGKSDRPAGITLRMAAPTSGSTLRVERSIIGPLDLPRDMECVSLVDSIADATAFPVTLASQLPLVLASGPSCTVERSTILGSFECRTFEASLSVFTGTTTVRFRQQGCVRFCYFGPNSSVPRRYECAPSDPPPVFTSTEFGDPGYTQLVVDCQSLAVPGECAGSPINYGENGQEMGVWSSLGSLRRLNHLRLRLTEYLPAGLVPVFIFES